MLHKAIIIHPNDNVATLTSDVAAGEEVQVFLESGKQERIKARQFIPSGHKLALEKIEKGSYIYKFGEPIGQATSDILIGEYVHLHNVLSLSQEEGENRME